MKKLALVLILVLLASTCLAGCVLTDKLASLKEGFQKDKDNKDDAAQTPTVVIETPETAPVSNVETKIVALYFTDDSGKKLMAEEREIPKVEGIARATMNELIKGPTKTGIKHSLPVTTQLLDINVRPDGLAIVDFSNDLVQDLPTSAESEKLAVYSVVNTLTQFPTVDRVEIRIDGKRVDTLKGNVELNTELVTNVSLIK